MFSIDTTLHGLKGHSSRNPRRRPRASGEDFTGVAAGQAPAKRRKRSSITTETFHAPETSKINGLAHVKSHNELAHKENGAKERTPEPEPALEQHQNGGIEKPTSLVVRSRSGRSVRERKPTRHDEGVLLAKNDRYQVSKETNLPDEVQDVIRGKEPWQPHFNENIGYVVLLTHQKAVVWRYAQSSSSNTLRIATIKFPNANYKPKDPLPIGVVVRDPASGELALLVVKAGGKVTYWESVVSASTPDLLRQKQSGLQGNVEGLLSGEQVIALEVAEPDGYVLTTTAGRIIHISVCDAISRPTIVTDLLRSGPTGSNSLFGSIKNVFNISSWRKDIAGVKCTVSKDKRNSKCLVITKQGVIQGWNLVRQANKTLELQVDAKASILKFTREADGRFGDMQVVDFAFFPNRKDHSNGHHILLFVGVQLSQNWSYYLLDATIEKDSLIVNASYPLNCWSEPPEDDKPWLASRSRLHIPDPGHTAIITFDTAILVASLPTRSNNPDSQLQAETAPEPDAFQDVLYFAKDRDLQLLGSVIEPGVESGAASCLLFVNDFGLAQVSAARFKKPETAEHGRANQCKAKIEQVVFFGDTPNKLFDFHKAMDVADWSSAEVQAAALKINKSILDSTSGFVAVAAPSMDHLLKERSTNLKSLIKFISRWDIDTKTRWKLLWSAEKMVAARAVWQAYSTHLSRREEQKIPFRGRNTVLLWEAVDAIHEQNKHEINPDKGENDVVRQYLTKDVANLETLVAFAAKAINEMAQDNVDNTVQQAWLVSQACDVVRAALDTAFKFRESNAFLYGFAPELFEDGIYKGNYKHLSELWTSCHENCLTIPILSNIAQDIAFTLGKDETSDDEGPEIEEKDLVKLVEDASSMARLSCQIFEEHYLFLEQTGSSSAESFKEVYELQRKNLLTGFVDLEVPDEGLHLAEKYRDLGALAEIICRAKGIIDERMYSGTEEEDLVLQDKLKEYEQKIGKYFRDYGMNWAQAYYTEKMAREGISEVLKAGGQSLSEFLAKNAGLIKAKWMDDVAVQQSYKVAVHDLLKCNSGETNLWNKKVQLSLAKLSLLAAEEQDQVPADTAMKQMRHADRRLTTIEIQDHLYNYTHPHLQSALDVDAAVGLAMGTFGKNVKKTKVQAITFRESIDKLIRRHWVGEDNLIDCLTLISCPSDILDDAEFAAHRFFFALQTLRDSPNYEDTARTSFLQKIIWRRCIIQDDWSLINITELKSDEEVAQEAESTALFKTLIAGLFDGLLETDLPPPHSLQSLLGTGTTADYLRQIDRWANSDDATLQAIASEYTTEDSKLAEIIEKGRLESWWQGLIAAARAELRRRTDSAGETGAEQNAKDREVEKVLSNGVNGANGHSGDIDADAERDEEGDVVMG